MIRSSEILIFTMAVSVQTLTGSNLEFSSLKNGTVMDLKLCIQQEISLAPLNLNNGMGIAQKAKLTQKEAK